MDVSNLYVPDSKKWIDFYWNNYVNHKNSEQFGGSLTYRGKPSIHPIEPPPRIKETQEEVPVKIISPAQAVVEQAETEIKRQGLKRRAKCQTTSQRGKRLRVKTQDYLS